VRIVRLGNSFRLDTALASRNLTQSVLGETQLHVKKSNQILPRVAALATRMMEGMSWASSDSLPTNARF